MNSIIMARQAAIDYVNQDGEYFYDDNDRIEYINEVTSGKCDDEMLVLAFRKVIDNAIEMAANIVREEALFYHNLHNGDQYSGNHEGHVCDNLVKEIKELSESS